MWSYRVFLLFINQKEYHLVHNQQESCHYDHIPFNLRGITNLVSWLLRVSTVMAIRAVQNKGLTLDSFKGVFSLIIYIFQWFVSSFDKWFIKKKNFYPHDIFKMEWGRVGNLNYSRGLDFNGERPKLDLLRWLKNLIKFQNLIFTSLVLPSMNPATAMSSLASPQGFTKYRKCEREK